MSASPPVAAKRQLVYSASLGEPPKKKRRHVTETIEFTIHDFKNKRLMKKEIESPSLLAHGHHWKMRISPDIFVGYPHRLGLEFYLDEDYQKYLVLLPVDYYVRIRFRKEILDWQEGYFDESMLPKSLKENLDEYLDEDGSFTIAADIRMIKHKPWYPKKLQSHKILTDLYDNGASKTSDAVFSVDGTTFHAHKSILSLGCKGLYDIANEFDNSGSSTDNTPTIRINGVGAVIFKSILEYVYEVKAPEVENEESAKELLVASDRFNCVELKLYVESVLVDKFLNAKNAAAMLILADSHSCALLKEESTNAILADPATVKEAQEDWSKVLESGRLARELLEASLGTPKGPIEAERLDVRGLRTELQNANLELDGSREILVGRLLANIL